jgi:uncharacterized damage-inducible protein DinB
MSDFDPVGTIEFFRQRHRAESATTAKVLQAVPTNMLEYRVHPGSSTVGTTAWTIVRCLQVSNQLMHFNSTDVPHSAYPTHEALLAEFHRGAESLQRELVTIDQTRWLEERRVISNGDVILQQPLGQILWLFLFDGIHHRGQLSTYLRPMGAKVPSIYGPSADTTA